MKPSLQVRLSQHLALTPQLQQSIRLLQLSTLELHQEVEQMLDQNPFLEAEEDTPTHEEPPLPERAAAQRDEYAASDESGGGEEAPREVNAAEFGTTEREDWSNGTEGDDFDGIRELPSLNGSTAGPGAGDDDLEPQERSAHGLSLAEHLQQQLVGMRLAPEERAAIHVLIESLNEDGYLADSLEEITAGVLGDGADDEQREALLEGLQMALKWLQSLDPVGIGARDLPECLMLQLRARERCEAQAVAIIVAKQHLDLLARRDFKKLAAATGADNELLKAAQAMIVQCEPKPGRPFVRSQGAPVVPDVIVQKAGRAWRVVLNPDVMPRLRINDLYAQAIKGGRGSGGQGASPLAARLQEARWFVKNVQQRFDTIVRVSQAIVERQKGFFTHGEIAMRPLVLREIADELGLHESTISRVTTAKYMATPLGTFELKYFFGSGLATEAGGNASSTAVRALIRQLVAQESEDKPLSDNQLSEMLAEQGITVARRTVAKYREALKIAPANLRRAL
jgi:RNA polymerase sigma-54 factor